MKTLAVLNFDVESLSEGECHKCVAVHLRGTGEVGTYADQELTIEVIEEDAKAFHVFQRVTLELRERPADDD